MKISTKFKRVAAILLLVIPCVTTAKKPEGFSDYQCMVANLYFEARGEGYEGMKAVAAVTLNRVKSKKYPPNICAVVFQRKQFSWTHQKRWVHIQRIMQGDTSGMKAQDVKAYNLAAKVALRSVRGALKVPKLEGSMYYHAVYVNPKWAGKMQRIARVGTHVFYRS